MLHKWTNWKHKNTNKRTESHSVVSNSLQPYGIYSPQNSPGQITGVGSLSLLQETFPTQGSNPVLLHCRWVLYQLRHKGSPKINGEAIGKLHEKLFRMLIVKITKSFEDQMEKMQKSINKDLEEAKNKHTETSNIITEIKNTLEEINSRISAAEGWISELEDKMMK